MKTSILAPRGWAPVKTGIAWSLLFLASGIQQPASVFAAGTTGAEFLNLGAGARAAAMGDAFTAVSDNATAIFWNPAGLSLLRWREAYFSHQVWIENVRMSRVAYAHPALGGTWAAGLVRLGSGALQGRDEQDRVTGEFEVVNQAVSVGYGRRFGDRFSAGAAATAFQEKVDDAQGAGFVGTAGALFDLPLEDQTVRWGAAVKNVGGKSGPAEKSDSPSALHLGVSDRLLNETLILSAEGVLPAEGDWKTSLGGEILVGGYFTLRAGYRFQRDDTTGLGGVTAGLGAVVPAGWDTVIDYAYAGQGDLGISHRVSLSLRF
jgi:hypothetical protein